MFPRMSVLAKGSTDVGASTRVLTTVMATVAAFAVAAIAKFAKRK